MFFITQLQILYCYECTPSEEIFTSPKYSNHPALAVPKPTDILLFGNETAVVEQWDDKCIKLQALQYDYIDRGWLIRSLEKIKLIHPKFKHREIDFREKAYLIGNTYKEC